MKTVRTILYIYCLVAIVVGLGAAVATLVQANQLGEEVNLADLRLIEATQMEQVTNANLKELEKIQRRDREQYTGPEAIDASVLVQDAQAIHQLADAEKSAAEAALRQFEEQLDRRHGLLIPILALILLHGAVAFFFSPVRSS